MLVTTYNLKEYLFINLSETTQITLQVHNMYLINVVWEKLT